VDRLPQPAKVLACIAIGAAALALAGAAAGAPASKVKLTVAVSGSGTVRSRPAGIDCKPECTLTVRKNAKVVLTAHPGQGAELSHWSAPCGRNVTCTVKMTAGKTVHAYFVAVPKPPSPPPPPPSPKAGHYVGTYSDGTFFTFDVNGSVVSNFNFDFNGECDNGGTENDSGTTVSGPFVAASDGSFSGAQTITYSNATGTFDLTGTVSTSGAASGTLKISVAFDDGVGCTSSGTWTAQDQS
jgi:hypothetical protein